MPNIITHTIFAQEVAQKEKDRDIAALMERGEHLYVIGANGPDFLFFSHAKPWEAYKSHKLNHLGSAMHAEGINAFYAEAVRCVHRQTHTDVRKDMCAYLFGHLCHWALDMVTHPYIFYRTGDCKGKSAGYHHRMESTIDAIMLRRMRDEDITQWRSYELCTFDEDMLKAIARIYVPCAKAVYGVDVKVHELRETLESWHDVQKLLYDPSGRRYRLLQGAEKLIGAKWRISGNVVPACADPRYDVMNDERRFWVHPCDDQIVSNATFMDLFTEAQDVAVQVIEAAWRCIDEGADICTLTDILNDRAYDTGMGKGAEMRHFDIIYEEEMDETV